MRCLFLILILFQTLFLALPSSAYIVSLSNQSLVVLVDSETGRFALQTSEGDPNLISDQGVYLLYNQQVAPGVGSPTSAAYLNIDGGRFTYGAEPGEWTQFPTRSQDWSRITSKWGVAGLNILQTIRIVLGPTTGRMDTVEFSYQMRNDSEKMRIVSFCILLDTLLGKEDGAQFRVPGVGAITGEKLFPKAEIPSYWYSFDDLASPTVRAQGTLLRYGDLPPDTVFFGSWGKIRENPWSLSLSSKKQGFQKGMLTKSDSAVGVYWINRKIAPGETFQFKTYYGLYGASVAQSGSWALSLGGALATSGEPVIVNADIQNTGAVQIRDSLATILLPESLRLTNTLSSTDKLGLVLSKEMRKSAWTIVPTGSQVGEFSYTVIVHGKDENGTNVTVSAERMISISKPVEEVREAEKEKILSQILTENKDLEVEKTDQGLTVEMGDISFQYNSFRLTPEALAVLDKLGKALSGFQEFRVEIEGHTDNIGGESFNLDLSKQRAQSVFKYFVSKGYATEDKIVYRGYGQSQPIASNSTEAGRKKNRRVKIIIIPTN